MIERLHIEGYELELDKEATAAAYSRIATPGPEDCGCAYCRNWTAGRDKAVPCEALALLSKLGIPANGEIEVYEYPGGSKSHGYGGWYMFVGRIISKPADETKGFGEDTFIMRFTSGQSFRVPAFDGYSTCELQFLTELDEYLSLNEYDTTRAQPAAAAEAQKAARR